MRPIRRVWITRAEPGATRTAERLRTMGFEPVVQPLLAIRHLSPDLDLVGIDAIAFTSRNGVAAFTALAGERAWPVHAVGDATAAAARTAGFVDVTSAAGDVSALATLIRQTQPPGSRILHVTAKITAADLSEAVGRHMQVRTLVAYEAIETGLGPPDGFDAILIHSPRAARVLASMLTADAACNCAAVAISDTAAWPLRRLGFDPLLVADQPNDASVTAALGKPGLPV